MEELSTEKHQSQNNTARLRSILTGFKKREVAPKIRFVFILLTRASLACHAFGIGIILFRYILFGAILTSVNINHEHCFQQEASFPPATCPATPPFHAPFHRRLGGEKPAVRPTGRGVLQRWPAAFILGCTDCLFITAAAPEPIPTSHPSYLPPLKYAQCRVNLCMLQLFGKERIRLL